MNKKTLILFILLASMAVLSLGPNLPQDKKDIQAYVVKVIRDVNKRAPTTGWQKAVALDRLKSGYELKTDKGSLAVILFADQTKLVVREKSVVTIRGEVQGRQVLSRDVHMDKGNIQFNVKKQEQEQFRFSSPISVASIRGTTGSYGSGGNEDFLTIAEGLADFTNSISGRTIPVTTGETGRADSTGKLGSKPASADELNKASNGGAGDDDKKDDGQRVGGSGGSGVVVDGSIGFDPAPTAGKVSMVKVDLSKTNTDLSSVKFFYRAKGGTEFKTLTLALAAKVGTGDIPADDLTAAGLEYYLEVKLSNNSVVNIPQAGAAGPTGIDVAAPITSTPSASGLSITATPVFTPSPLRAFVNLGVGLDLATVAQDIQSVTLNYRKEGGSFKPLAMTMAGKVAGGQIPGSDVLPGALSYYFVIKLQGGVEVMLPSGGEGAALNLTVPPLRRVVPTFSTLKSKAPGNVRLDFSSVDATVAAVTFFYKKANEATYKEGQMTVSGKSAALQFQGADLKFPKMDYYFTFRLDDGTVVTIPAEGSASPLSQQVQAVPRELRIPGQTGKLERKVIVLRWNE